MKEKTKTIKDEKDFKSLLKKLNIEAKNEMEIKTLETKLLTLYKLVIQGSAIKKQNKKWNGNLSRSESCQKF
ncbi:MAG: hypothetical protein KatS3mg095_0686 [Candidatus Parcubacteria bacterium]|nr:MAG: hypothetical protein KatS3mg094_620 [Candidatus Parcubacteria bacterium]GIW66788.1 MAG: hypothetical protein KatS3mg095_0686 [Candidatus Parcubacteria bacterium]